VRALVSGSVHGMPKLTIKKLRPAGFARHCSVYHNKFTYGFISITLSTAMCNTTGVYINKCQLKQVT